MSVDGTERGRIRLTKLLWSTVLVDGVQVARAKMKLGGEPRVIGDSAHRVVSKGAAWEYKGRDEYASRHELKLSRASRRPAASRGPDPF